MTTRGCASRAMAPALAAIAWLAWLAPAVAAGAAPLASDGRADIGPLMQRFATLERQHGWLADLVHAYPGEGAPEIRAWRTPHRGPALWLIAGIHGEEPAGPNAIAAGIGEVAALAREGVPVVLIPLANTVGYRNNWRYPNTADRDWRGGGYSIGDAEFLLPAIDAPERARAPAPPGADTRALGHYVLDRAGAYPPRLVIDLHEDELSMSGGYIYSQGRLAAAGTVEAQVLDALRSAGMPLRLAGRTRFDEPIVAGVVRHDAQGAALRDGSLDELLAAAAVIRDGRAAPGPAAGIVIVVETPAFAGSRLPERVAAHAAVLARLPALWRLAGAATND